MLDTAPTVVIYHDNCNDGITAAWAVWKALGDIGVAYQASAYGVPPALAPCYGADVVIVDFSYKRPVLLEIAAVARSVIVIDHHESSAEDLAGFPQAFSLWSDSKTIARSGITHGCTPRTFFDMRRAGAMLTWNYFHPNTPVPAIVRYAQDRDLWKFDLANTRAVHAAMASYPRTLAQWEKLANDLEQDEGNLIHQGEAILRALKQERAAAIADGLTTIAIAGHTVPCLNVPKTMVSDTGHELLDLYPDAPFVALYFDAPRGRIMSLRARDGDSINVREIAVGYGGGGHAKAAGFAAPHGWRGDVLPRALPSLLRTPE